jgi:hypothetical protein
MPASRARRMTPAELAYLRQAMQDTRPYQEMADHLHVCIDTLKRILMREGLASFSAAKYVLAQSEITKREMWNRPCLSCGSTKLRPRWIYVCSNCKKNRDDSGLDEHTIFF